MPKQDCIIDACSYIYLSRFKFLSNGEKEITPLDLLAGAVNLQHHSVISSEIKRNIQPSPSPEEAIKLSNNEFQFRKYTQNHYDSKIFNNEISTATTSNNLGEKGNLISYIDLLLRTKKIPIFLTDDLKAINSFNEKDYINTYLVNIWTSFDVIVYLFLTTNKISFELAKDAITDFIKFLYDTIYQSLKNDRDSKISEAPRKRKEIEQEFSVKISEKKSELQHKKISYVKRLDLIHILKND